MEKQLIEKQQHEEQLSGRENMHRIIGEWKKRREQDEREAAERFNSPRYQEIFKKLAEENEQRRKSVPLDKL